MKKYTFYIPEVKILSNPAEPNIYAKFQFYAQTEEDAEIIKERLSEAYANSPAVKPPIAREELMYGLDDSQIEVDDDSESQDLLKKY